jgi:hypothetical protein
LASLNSWLTQSALPLGNSLSLRQPALNATQMCKNVRVTFVVDRRAIAIGQVVDTFVLP